MQREIIALAVALLAAADVGHAQVAGTAGTAPAVEATGGNKVLQLRYLAPAPGARLGSSADLDYGILFSENRDIIVSTALLFHTVVRPLPRLTIGVGPQAYLAWLSAQQKTNFFALSLGVTARYEIWRDLGIAAFGSAFYSPGVLTLGSAHNLYDFTAGAEARLLPRLDAIGGYRWLKVTTVGQPDLRVVNELFVGLRWTLRQ